MDLVFDLTIKDYSISYIAWNTILGGAPFFLCFYMFKIAKEKKSWFRGFFLAFLFLTWLFFAPNASYIITDVRHLNGFCPDTTWDNCMRNAWMIMFFFVYGLWGWILHFYTLEQMIIFIRRNISSKIASLFPFLISPLLAMGVLLGLVERFNTWDILFRPWGVIERAFSYLYHLESFINLLAFSFALLFLYYLGRLLFRPMENINKLNKLIK